MPLSKNQQGSTIGKKIEASKRDGWRRAIYKSTGYYKGEWQNDQKEGRGTELTRNGWLYDGEWSKGRRHGYGILRKLLKDGTTKNCCAGIWVDGKLSGYGERWYQNGSHFEGTFLRNQREGYGKIWHNNGNYYQGTWRNDRYHGNGILFQADGSRYEGEFANGKKNGYGKYYHVNSGQLQKGLWKDDVCVSGTIEDTDSRHFAVNPTPYPIGRIRVNNQACVDSFITDS